MVKMFGAVGQAHNRAGRRRSATLVFVLALILATGFAIGRVIAPAIQRQAVHECSLEESLHAVRTAMEEGDKSSMVSAHLVNAARRLDQAIADLRLLARAQHPSSSQAARTLARIGELARQE